MANGLINFNPRTVSLRNRPSGAITAQGQLPVGYNIPSNLGILTMPGGGMENLRMPMPGTLNPTNLPDVGFQAAQAQPPAEEKKTLGSRARGILGSIGGFLSNPDVLDTLAIGLGGMSLRPNQALMQQAANRIQQRQEIAAMQSYANRTAEYFRSIGRDDLAQAVEASPEQSRDILGAYYESKFTAPRPGQTVGNVQTDQETGQQYVAVFNPDTSEIERVDIPEGFGLTREQSADLEMDIAMQKWNQEQSQKKALDIFNEIERNRGTLNVLDEMDTLLRQGARSGVLTNLLPALDEATAALRQSATRLGLGVISSVTFGALSAQELNLALTTEIDINLPEDQLRAAIARKTAAIKQRQEDLIHLGNLLNSGMPYDEFQREFLRGESERIQSSQTSPQESRYSLEELVAERQRRSQGQ